MVLFIILVLNSINQLNIFYYKLSHSQQQMLEWIKNKTSKNRKQFGKYNFYVRHEPQTLDSSTTLTLTTYTNTSQNATIPCRYRWSIIKNGLTIQVPQFKGSSFKCQPSDVGSLIQAQVISTDSEYGGTAIIQFGPVKLDVTLKKQIQIALSTGCATMPVYLVNNNVEQKQCQIRVMEDIIKINHAYSQTNYMFDYSIFQPRIQCISKDSSRVVIIFPQKYQSELKRFTKRLFDQSSVMNPPKDLTSSVKSNQSTHISQHNLVNKLDIKFMNRNSRDIFLFAIKAFNTKKQLKSSTILNKIQKIDFSNQQTFDYILQIEGLKSQLVKMDYVVRKAHQQKMKYLEEVHRLEKQIQEIIITYTRIVQQKFQNQAQLSRDYSMLSAKRDQIVSKKYKNLENQNNHLNSRIQTLAKQIDTIRFKPVHMPTTPIQPLMSPVNQIGQTGQKIHFNYEANPFTKKKSYQQNGIGNILDDLNQSRISYISTIRQDPMMLNKLQQVQKQKQQLQKKLQMSFHKIDNLQKQLFQKQLNRQNQKLNSSAIHFTYNLANNNNDSMANFTQPLNMSMVVDKQKQNLVIENKQLKRSNQNLLAEKKKLINDLKNSALQMSPPQYKSRDGKGSSDNSLNFLRTQKKDSTFSDKQKQLLDTIIRKDKQIHLLKTQNQQLKKSIQKLNKNLELIKFSTHNHQKLQKKVRDLQQQVEMYRKNADALNRSQQLSMEMDSYNDQQITMLKQHNQFLTNQNQKLAKACERYMGEAKQANKLRMEIIKLKEKINELQSQLVNGSSMLGII